MKTRCTSATPAGIPRSRSSWTRRERAEIRRNCEEVEAQARAYRELYGEDDFNDDYEPVDDDDRCYRCGGDGVIEYAEGGPEVWGEDCPSEVNHLVPCPDCSGF